MNKDNKKFVIETVFLKEALKHDLSLAEFLILVYFDNDYDSVFDIKKVMKVTCLKEDTVVMAFDSLLNKGLITLVSSKNENGQIYDSISLEKLYSGINNNNKEKDSKEDFMAAFQKAYGHALSNMDFELIKGWLSCGYSEELILGAVAEANYNGKASLRYIDKILDAWNNKGFKTMQDVNNHLMNKSNSEEDNKYETGVWDFDWLDNEE